MKFREMQLPRGPNAGRNHLLKLMSFRIALSSMVFASSFFSFEFSVSSVFRDAVPKTNLRRLLSSLLLLEGPAKIRSRWTAMWAANYRSACSGLTEP